MTTRFDSKDPGEEVTLGFDFTALGAPSNPDVQIAVRSGEDPDPGAMMEGAAVATGGWVYQRVIGGLDDVDYSVRCYADVGSDRLLIDAILPVRARPAP